MKGKVEAIYDLREAAEHHALAEAAVDEHSTVAARGALLEAREQLEEATFDAIESCHQCGGPHAGEAHDENKPSGEVIPIGGHAPAAQ